MKLGFRVEIPTALNDGVEHFRHNDCKLLGGLGLPCVPEPFLTSAARNIGDCRNPEGKDMMVSPGFCSLLSGFLCSI